MEALEANKPGKRNPLEPPPRASLRITQEELEAARLTPREIVKDYLYANVAVLVAPGGVGKTTIQLYEMACLAIGRPIWGLHVPLRCRSLLVTAEDSRETCVARLREIMANMGLTQEEWRTILESIEIWDVTGEAVKLTVSRDRNLELTELADNIIKAYQDEPIDLIGFDPLISFGASQQQVNDNEQALVEVARRIQRALDCCVRYVAHTGQAKATNQDDTQYAIRGGSAMSDGCRMVAVMHLWGPNSKETLPPGCKIGTGMGVIVLSRPRLSYSPPNLPKIFVRRDGYRFEHFSEPPRLSPTDLRKAHADQLERYIASELKLGRKHTQRTLEAIVDELCMSRQHLRGALDELRVSRRVHEEDLPMEERQGGRKTFLSVLTAPTPNGAVGKKTPADGQK